MLPTHLKVGLVTLFSCLVLMLGLFSSTGIASAHSTQALQSQTSQANTSTLADDRCRFIVVRSFEDFGGNSSFSDRFNPFGHRFDFFHRRSVFRVIRVCTHRGDGGFH